MKKPVTAPATSNTKKDLIILFAAPTMMILVAISLVYVPRFFAHPTYDFVYSTCESYNCSSYSVNTGEKITINQPEYPSTGPHRDATLYYYDTSEDTSTKLSYTSARSYDLISSRIAPDNYELTRAHNSGGVLFWDSSSNDSIWFLADGLKKKQLTLTSHDSYYDAVNFIGWIQR